MFLWTLWSRVLAWHVRKMWEHCRCLESVQQNSICKHLDHHHIRTWKCGQAQNTLELFGQMQQEGSYPNLVTFVQALIACADIVALEQGRCVHEQKIVSGTFFFQMCLCGAPYLTCMQNMAKSWRMFGRMPSRNAVLIQLHTCRTCMLRKPLNCLIACVKKVYN